MAEIKEYDIGDEFRLEVEWWLTDQVGAITITSGGSGYTSAPTVVITSPKGTGATATATVSGGAVVSVAVTDGGQNYTDPPTISFSGGGGTGATATPVMGRLTSPDTVTLLVQHKGATTPTTYTQTPGQIEAYPTSGMHYMDMVAAAPYGLYTGRWIGTGLVRQQQEVQWYVKKPVITPP